MARPFCDVWFRFVELVITELLIERELFPIICTRRVSN